MNKKAKTRILLVQPYGFDISIVLPLALAYLDAQIDKDHFETKVLDCSLKGITADSEQFVNEVLEFKPDVVGVSMWSFVYPEGMALLKKTKSIVNNVITIVGGVHTSMNYEEVIKNENVDLLLRGEAEFTFPKLMEKIRNSEDYKDIEGLVFKDKSNKIVNNKQHTLVENLDEIVRPNYESIDLAEYTRKGYSFKTKINKNAPVWLTRGCPYKCQYCSSPDLSGKDIRKHSLEYITSWVNHLYHDHGVRFINIIDDQFTFDVPYAKAVCKTIIKLNYTDLFFGTPNGVRMERGDTELWALMKDAGWKGVIIAPESGSPRTLKRMKKGLDPKIIPEVVKEIQSVGLFVHAFFIVGYPGETKEDLMDTRKMIIDSDVDSFSLFPFQALPGTPVFHTLVASGEISANYVPATDSIQKQNNDYTTVGLKDVNITLFRVMTFILVYLRKPLKIKKFVSYYRFSVILKQLTSMFKTA